MESAEEPQQRLASRVKARRLELGLSVRAVAQLATIDRNTWYGIEEGARKTQDRLFAGVERALQWPIGHITAILEATAVRPTVPRPTFEELQAMSIQEFGDLQRRIVREEGLAAADAHLEEVRALYADQARKVPPRR